MDKKTEKNLKTIFEKYPSIKLVYLFGSQARGDVGPLSDFDFAFYTTEKEQKNIFNFYLKNTKKINNWDLVDSSADKILGEYLLDKSEKDKKIIYKLAVSKNLWERRIAMITTFQFNKFFIPTNFARVRVTLTL